MSWEDDPVFGQGSDSHDWESDPVFNQGQSQPKSGWRSLVDGVTHAIAATGEGAVHGLPDAIGFLGDLGIDMKNIQGAWHGGGKVSIPGMGPVSQSVSESFNKAEQDYTKGHTPTPRNAPERYANAASRAAANMLLLGGPKNVGGAVASGVGQGVGGEAAHDLFPNSKYAPLIGSLIGGVAPVIPHVAGAIRTGSLIRAGMAHPDFDALVQEAIIPSEGGGTLEHPKTNAKSGAQGIMQVTPETARDPGYGIRPWDGKSQADLARVGRQKFAVLLGKYNDPEKALAAYNWGEGNLNKAIAAHGNEWYDHAPKETQNYVAKGMTKVYGGPKLEGPPGPDGLPTNGSVAPIDAARMARIMGDQDMIDALSKPEAPKTGPEEVLTPAEKQEMDASVNNPPSLNAATDRMENFSTDQPPPVAANAEDNAADAVNAVRQQVFESAQKMPEKGTPEYEAWQNNHQQLQAALEDVRAKYSAGKEQAENTPPPPPPPTEPPSGTGGSAGGEPPPTAVDKLQSILTDVDKLRSEQDAKVADIRRQRYQEAGKRSSMFSGEQGAAATMGALKGKMPKTRIRSFRKRFGQDELDELFKQVQDHPAIDWQTELHATSALQKLLNPRGNRLPTRSELNALGLVFPKEMVEGLKKHSTIGKIITNTLSIPRALMASADFSAPLRQGIFMIGRKEFYGAARGMFKKAISQADFDAMQSEIASRPTHGMMKKGGLSLTDVTQDLTKREEAFMSNYAEQIPGIGRVVKASDRAYIGFLNRVRADVFDNLAARYAELNGESISKNPKALKDLCDYINAATGRGSLGKFTEAAPFLSAGLFAPRLIASRLQLLNPFFYARLDPFVRKEALKDLFKFAGTALTVLTLAKMGGLQVEADPRSTDFGKIRAGDTRFDILGGFQQYIRTFAQIITSQTKNSDTGKVTNLKGGFGLHLSKGVDQSDYKATTALDQLTRLFFNKAAPVPEAGLDALRGGDAVGQPFDWKIGDDKTLINFKNPVIQRAAPLLIQDVADAYKEYGLKSPVPYAVAATGVFGVGTQTYKPVKHAHKDRSSDSMDNWEKDPIFSGRF